VNLYAAAALAGVRNRLVLSEGGEPSPPLESHLLSIGNAVLDYDYNYVQPYTLFPCDSTTYNSFRTI
jgi:hypothetical protein